MGFSIIMFLTTMAGMIYIIKKNNNINAFYFILIPVFITILIIIFTFAEGVGKGFFEIERIPVVENMYEGKYLFKRDVDGGYSVLEKSNNSLVYTKIINVDKDSSYSPDDKLYFIVYETKVSKSDFFRIGVKSFKLKEYSFSRIKK